MQLKVTVNGEVFDVSVEVEEAPKPTLGSIVIGATSAAAPVASPPSAGTSGGGANSIKAPLSGTVARILVEAGQEISAGDVLVVLEAMKMETEIKAPSAGTVSAVLVAPGDAVQGGQPLIRLDRKSVV